MGHLSGFSIPGGWERSPSPNSQKFAHFPPPGKIPPQQTPPSPSPHQIFIPSSPKVNSPLLNKKISNYNSIKMSFLAVVRG